MKLRYSLSVILVTLPILGTAAIAAILWYALWYTPQKIVKQQEEDNLEAALREKMENS